MDGLAEETQESAEDAKPNAPKAVQGAGASALELSIQTKVGKGVSHAVQVTDSITVSEFSSKGNSISSKLANCGNVSGMSCISLSVSVEGVHGG